MLALLFIVSFFPCHSKAGEPGSVEERRILAALQEEKASLADQQQQLAAKELQLKTLEVEVDKKLSELGQLREETQKLLAQKEEKENARTRNLGKMYEKMDPSKAASVLVTLDTKLAVDILANMKQKSAGKILNSMEGEKAAALSVAFATLSPN